MLSSDNVTLKMELSGKRSILLMESGQGMREVGLWAEALWLCLSRTARPARLPRWRQQPGKSPRHSHALLSHTWVFSLQSAHLFLMYFILLISDDHFRMFHEQSFSPPDFKASAEASHLDRFFFFKKLVRSKCRSAGLNNYLSPKFDTDRWTNSPSGIILLFFLPLSLSYSFDLSHSLLGRYHHVICKYAHGTSLV